MWRSGLLKMKNSQPTINARNHVIIAGTGRTGTTFLVSLCSRLGLDTGFDYERAKKKISTYESKAGLEHHLSLNPNLPYIVKDPRFYTYMDSVIQNPLIHIDHVFIPMRSLYEASQSRISQGLNKRGGVWLTSDPKAQEEVLQKMIYDLFLKLSSTKIPITLLQYPKITREPDYLFHKLQPILNTIDYNEFLEAFSDVVEPSWVNEYNKK